MSAKILAFDPNRRIPPRHYTPIAMRGKLLVMPLRTSAMMTDSQPTATGELGDAREIRGETRISWLKR
jgi:hypothetical protein